MAAFFFILLLVYLCITLIQPPARVLDNAPLAEFSSGRAMRHLRNIAQKAHPTGSMEHARVREYIINELSALGVEPSVQEASVVAKDRGDGRPVAAGTMRNIVARVRGTDNSKALMLAAHYDSVNTAPGASDDGAGVVTLLETLRALKTGAPLKNDVIFLFTDGEELGLLGARAFVAEHPWMRDVGLVLNFEARGAGGPSLMFETSEGNGTLISELERSAPHVVASSLMYAVYKRLPNDTDMTVFKGAGVAGLNFAYADCLTSYHTQLDSVEEIDERSLQHHGSYALTLARDFGNLDLRETRVEDRAYFNLLGTAFVSYSSTWIVPLTIFVKLVFIYVMWLGLKKRILTLKGMAAGFFALLICGGLSGFVAHAAWWLIRKMNGGFDALPYQTPYNIRLYEVGCVLLAVAVSSVFYATLARRISLLNLHAGALLVWLALMLLATFALPLGAFLFAWPLLFALGGLAFFISAKDRSVDDWKSFGVAAACALPCLVLVVPLIYMLLMMLGMTLIGFFMVLLVMLYGLALPLLDAMHGAKRWRVPSGALFAGVMFIGAGLLTTGLDAHRRQANSIFYHLNADTAQARWVSTDAALDSWTKQFISSENAKHEVLADIFPWATQPSWQAGAPSVALVAPNVTALEDHTDGDVRTLRLRISSARQAPSLLMFTDPETEVLRAFVNNHEVTRATPQTSSAAQRRTLRLSYAAPPVEGIELLLEVRAAKPLRLTVEDVSYELPQLPELSHAPRPVEMMPAPSFRSSDTTLVSKTFNF